MPVCRLTRIPGPKMGILVYEMAKYQYFITVIHLNSPGGPACNYLSFYTTVARAAAELHCLVSGSVAQWLTLGGSQYISS